MQDTITRLLTEALAQSLKEALVPIVREAVTEALASLPKADQTTEDDTQSNTPIKARLDALEEQVADLESSLSDKVDSSDIEEAVTNAIDNGSWDISFRG